MSQNRWAVVQVSALEGMCGQQFSLAPTLNVRVRVFTKEGTSCTSMSSLVRKQWMRCHVQPYRNLNLRLLILECATYCNFGSKWRFGSCGENFNGRATLTIQEPNRAC